MGLGDAGTWGCDTQGHRDVGHRNVRTRRHKTWGHEDLAVRDAGMQGCMGGTSSTACIAKGSESHPQQPKNMNITQSNVLVKKQNYCLRAKG